MKSFVGVVFALVSVSVLAPDDLPFDDLGRTVERLRLWVNFDLIQLPLAHRAGGETWPNGWEMCRSERDAIST